LGLDFFDIICTSYLFGVPRLPLSQLVPSSVLARNCPGRNFLFLLLFLSPMLPPFPSFPSVLRCSPFTSPLSVIGLRSPFVMNSTGDHDYYLLVGIIPSGFLPTYNIVGQTYDIIISRHTQMTLSVMT
jgi:hypothetical protein